ncbi:MAG: ABC transporter permease [Cryobacterium sp.]|nr:ABC transporter permease [Cryobacterium sp.]
MLRLNARQRRLSTASLALAPAVILLIALFGLPLLQLALISFRDSFPKATVAFTLENYFEIFSRPFHVESLGTSLLLAAVVTVITAVLGYPLAYYFVHSSSRIKSVIFLAILSPLLISVVVRSIGWLILLGQEGVINQTLVFLGILQEPIQMLYNFGAIVIGEVNILMPFMVLSLTTSLGQIPDSLYEGAEIMGATPFRRFLRITLPLSAPGLVSGAVLVFILTMGSYITPQMLGGGKVKVITIDIYTRMMQDFDWPVGAALAIVTMIFTLSIILLINRLQSKLMGGLTR